MLNLNADQKLQARNTILTLITSAKIKLSLKGVALNSFDKQIFRLSIEFQFDQDFKEKVNIFDAK